MTKEFEDKILDLGDHIRIIETLARVLNESYISIDNLKENDPQNLSEIILKELIELHKEFSEIDKGLVFLKYVPDKFLS